MNETDGPIEIAESIWWVGSRRLHKQLSCNPYLIISDTGSVLIDPGSPLDFEYVYHNICGLIDPTTISHIILHHQDPDLCSAVPLFEQRNIIRPVVTHWRASCITQYYGISGPFYLVDYNDYKLTLPSGRILRFIHTPYLHFPGAIITYDEESKTLFSSDLFGAFFIDDSLLEFFATPRYIEAMKSFHEHYMPGNAFLRPIMETLLNMPIQCIAPQHGAVIREDIPLFIRTLRDLECGSYLKPILKDRAKSGGYVGICNEVLIRCQGIAGFEATTGLFDDTDIRVDPQTGLIVDFSTSGEELWHNLFRIIEQKRGLDWLIALEVLMRKLSSEYSIPVPDVYQASLSDLAMKTEQLGRQYLETKVLSERLAKNIEETNAQLTLDAVCGLYNADFFMHYLQNEMALLSKRGASLLMIAIDNLQQINFQYGIVHGDAAIKNVARIIRNHASETMMLARLEGAVFGVFAPEKSIEDGVSWAESIRVAVSKSETFIQPTTVSIGVVHTLEIPETIISVTDQIQFVYKTAGMRIRIAKKKGSDFVCAESSGEAYTETSGKVLIVDTDKIHLDVLSTMLRQLGMYVVEAEDGARALDLIETVHPDIIISEVMLPKVDGFALRDKMTSSSHLKDKVFILTSHVKDEALVQQAHNLAILHYFQKPYLLSELVGLVRSIIRNRDLG